MESVSHLQSCRQCKRTLHIEEFQFKKNSLIRYKTCTFCQRKNNTKESQKDIILTANDLTNEKLDIIMSYPSKIIETKGYIPNDKSYAISSIINKGNSRYTWVIGSENIVSVNPGEVYTFQVPVMFWNIYYMSIECSFHDHDGDHSVDFSVREIPEKHRYISSERQIFEIGNCLLSFGGGLIKNEFQVNNNYAEKYKKFKDEIVDKERKEIIDFERRNKPYIFSINNEFIQSLNILELNSLFLREIDVNFNSFEVLEMKDEKQVDILLSKLPEKKVGIAGQFNISLQKKEGKLIYKLPIPFFDAIHKLEFDKENFKTVSNIILYTNSKILMHINKNTFNKSALDLNIPYIQGITPCNMYIEIFTNVEKINFSLNVAFFSNRNILHENEKNKIKLELAYRS